MSQYSKADQPARFAEQKATNNVRALNIDAVYNKGNVKGKTVIVTGMSHYKCMLFLLV